MRDAGLGFASIPLKPCRCGHSKNLHQGRTRHLGCGVVGCDCRRYAASTIGFCGGPARPAETNQEHRDSFTPEAGRGITAG